MHKETRRSYVYNGRSSGILSANNESSEIEKGKWIDSVEYTLCFLYSYLSHSNRMEQENDRAIFISRY